MGQIAAAAACFRDAAGSRIVRAYRRRARRDWRARVLRIGREQIAARGAVGDRTDLGLAGLRVRKHARLVERSAAGLRAQRAGLRRAVAGLRAGDIGFVRVNGEGREEATAEVGHKNPDAGFRR